MQGVDLEARLWALSGDLPCRIIPNEDGAPYLQRYYLGESGGRITLLHQLVRNDDVRGYHNHPWPNASSTILTGGYREHRAEQLSAGAAWSLWEEVHTAGSVRELDGDCFHRLQLLCDPVSGEPLPTWTLFSYVYGDVKPWGFIERANGCCGDFVFREHLYPECGNKKPTDWWLTAPRGRDMDRLRYPVL